MNPFPIIINIIIINILNAFFVATPEEYGQTDSFLMEICFVSLREKKALNDWDVR